MVSLTSFRSSMEKSPGVSPERMTPRTMLRVSLVLGERVELRFLERVCSVPLARVMTSSSGGFSAEGKR